MHTHTLLCSLLSLFILTTHTLHTPPSTLLFGSPSSSSPFYEHTTDLFNANALRYIKLIERNSHDARGLFNRRGLDVAALDLVMQNGDVDVMNQGAIYASDVKRPNAASASRDDAFCFPAYVGALGIVYNLNPEKDDRPYTSSSSDSTSAEEPSSTTNVIFSLEALVGIYNGTIRFWDHPLLRRLNPERTLPHELIHVLHRSDDSGTTWQLTSFFTHHSPAWASKYGNSTHVKWQIEQPYVISSSIEMLKYLSKIPFSIGYVSLQSMFDVANVHEYLQRVQLAQIVNSVRYDKKHDPKGPEKENVTSFAPNWQSIQKSFQHWHDEMVRRVEEEEDPVQPIQNVTYPMRAASRRRRAKSLKDWLFGGDATTQDPKSLHKLQRVLEHSLHNPLLLQEDGYPLTAFSYLCTHVEFDAKRDNIAKILYDFVEFSYQHASDTKEQFHIIALPETFQNYILDTLSEKLTCQGNACFSDTHYVQFMIIGLSAIITLLVALFIVTICCLSCGGGREWLLKKKGAFVNRGNTQSLGDSELLPLLGLGGARATTPADHLPHVYDHTLDLTPEKAASEGGAIEGLELIELIGRGSFSEVFFGRYHMSPCAVKRFFSLSPHDKIFELCKQEVEMLQRIHHPNIVQYLASFIDRPPNAYIVMEYQARGDLQRILLDSHNLEMPLRLKIKLARDAARGLFFLHSLHPPILHRDFKSSNLLISSDWTLKIGDLGLAKELSSLDQTMCGSAETASPEVFEHTSYTEKSDVYSYCMVLWQIFTRKRIYEGKTVLEVSHEVVFDNLRPPLKHEYLPEEIANILRRGWQKDPRKRPGMGEILEILEQMLLECDESDDDSR